MHVLPFDLDVRREKPMTPQGTAEPRPDGIPADAKRELVLLRERTKTLTECLKAEHENASTLQLQCLELATRATELGEALRAAEQQVAGAAPDAAVSDVNEELRLAHERIKALKEERAVDQQKMQELRLKLQQTIAASSADGDLTEELRLTKERIKALKEEREVDQQKLQALRVQAQQAAAAPTSENHDGEELRLAQERIQGLKDERANIQEKLHELRAKIEQQTATIASLRGELDDQPTRILTLPTASAAPIAKSTSGTSSTPPATNRGTVPAPSRSADILNDIDTLLVELEPASKA